jgi:hypothetical protein
VPPHPTLSNAPSRLLLPCLAGDGYGSDGRPKGGLCVPRLLPTSLSPSSPAPHPGGGRPLMEDPALPGADLAKEA